MLSRQQVFLIDTLFQFFFTACERLFTIYALVNTAVSMLTSEPTTWRWHAANRVDWRVIDQGYSPATEERNVDHFALCGSQHTIVYQGLHLGISVTSTRCHDARFYIANESKIALGYYPFEGPVAREEIGDRFECYDFVKSVCVIPLGMLDHKVRICPISDSHYAVVAPGHQ